MCMLGGGSYLEDSVPKNKPETQLIKELGVPQMDELKFHIHYPNDCFELACSSVRRAMFVVPGVIGRLSC